MNVASSGSARSITFSLPGLAAMPSVVISGVDFSAGTLTCNSNNTSCSVAVTFNPKSVGLKQDAVSLKTASGQVAASAFLHGIGVAPALRVLPGVISTLAGSGSWSYVDGSLSAAGFRGPQGLAIDPKGNVYVADSVNQVVRKISPAPGSVSTFAGNGNSGYSGDGGAALSATMNTPTDVVLDAAGNVFIADQGNGLIRRVDAVSGVISTVAGGGASMANGVAATTASLNGPNNVAVDVAGNLYISDSFHNLVRKVTAATGLITTVAGGGSGSGSDGLGNDGPATAAQLSDPTGIALDAAGNLYFADTGHNMVRQVNASTGMITAVAGSGLNGTAGDGGIATAAQLNAPTGVWLDANSDLYIADFAGQVARFVNATSGIISTVAGTGTAGYSGDGAFAGAAKLSSPSDVVVNAAGNLYIADYGNNVMRRVAFLPQTLAFPATSINATSAAVTVTMVNQGNATLAFSGLSVTGPFHQQAGGSPACTPSSSLSPGEACQVVLVFTPTAAGAASGTLRIQSNDANVAGSVSTVNLSGSGASGTPAGTLSTTSLTFAGQAVGTSSAASTVTLHNGGTAALAIATIQLTGANASEFAISATNCGSSLAVNASCTVSVTFSPAAAGTRTAALQFSDSAANSPQVVSLSGNGTSGAQPVTNVTSLTFTSRLVGTTSSPQTVTLSNGGTAPLGISGISLGGANGSEFSIYSYTCGSSLAAGASCNVRVTFSPGGTGTRTGALTFSFSGGLAAQAVTLSGGGLPLPCVSSISTSTQVFLAAGGTGSLTVAAPSSCAWTLTVDSSWVSITSPASGSGNATVSYTVTQNATAQPRVATFAVGSIAQAVYQMGVGLRFVPIMPCRVADTRNANGPLGGPSLAAVTPRSFAIPAGGCGIPSTAQSYSLNVAAVPKGTFHNLTIWPTGQSQPEVANLNSLGQVKSNAAIVPAGTNGAVSVSATDATDLILDINGYFVTAATAVGLEFYPLTPCRLVDTRNANGALGGPSLVGGTARAFPVLLSPCNVPSMAQAYSLNLAAIPRTPFLHYLTAWPSGQAQPVVSTLNGGGSFVIANAAIVGAGTSGDLSIYATDDSDLVVDINGYFAPPSGSSGVQLYNVIPCRAVDTRTTLPAPFTGAMTFQVSACPFPPQVKSYVLQVAVVPTAAFRNLTLWPAGTAQPLAATLNAHGGQVTSNLAIVPTSNGLISASANVGPTHLVLDMFGVFAP